MGEAIWDHWEIIHFFGVPLPHRMVVIRLKNGSLLVHSPTRCHAATRSALKELGELAHVVAPNRMHDLFLEDYAEAYPAARFWIPPGTEKYFRALRNKEELGDENAQAPWADELEFVFAEGVPRLNECIFYHRASRSVVFADLFFKIDREHPAFIRLAARLGGFYGKLGMPHDIRWFLLRNKSAFKRSMEQVGEWPFENVLLGHGSNVMGEGKAAFEKAIRWL